MSTIVAVAAKRHIHIYPGPGLVAYPRMGYDKGTGVGREPRIGIA